MPKPNAHARAVLKPIVATLAKHPELIDMDTWAMACSTKNGDTFCGTTGCIAGWVNSIYGIPRKFQEAMSDSGDLHDAIARGLASKKVYTLINKLFSEEEQHDISTPGDLAASFLKFDQGFYQNSLFIWRNWPEPFRSKYRDLILDFGGYVRSFGKLDEPTRKKLGKITIARLKHFLKEGE